jgi:hypothetical protein
VSHGFRTDAVDAAGLPLAGVVVEGLEHMRCVDGGKMWQYVSRVTVPIESAAGSSESGGLVIMSKRVDMTRDLADVYNVE